MSANQQQLIELQRVLFKEYGTTLSKTELLSEAVRLSEFAKTVLHFSLSKNEKLILNKK